MTHTLVHLDDLDDLAAARGMSHIGEARFAREALESAGTGLAYHRLNPGRRQGFAHRHQQAEEVAVVLAGSGSVTIDDQVVPLRAMDAVRISPTAARHFAAGPEGMSFLVFGPHHPGDGEMIPLDEPVSG